MGLEIGEAHQKIGKWEEVGWGFRWELTYSEIDDALNALGGDITVLTGTAGAVGATIAFGGFVSVGLSGLSLYMANTLRHIKEVLEREQKNNKEIHPAVGAPTTTEIQ